MPRKNIGPGPGKYQLPPLTGYPEHDFTKYRNPQYSMGVRLPYHKLTIGPGPQYNVRDMTPYGKATPPAFSMKSRPAAVSSFQVPGPGTYKNELVPRMKEPRPPMYSLSFRLVGQTGVRVLPSLNVLKIENFATIASMFRSFFKGLTPGPDVYTLPTTIGPKVPDMGANAAYSMSYRQPTSLKERSPGPARYNDVSVDMFKTKMPNFTMSPRVFPPDSKKVSPGPIYKPLLPEKPGYSFGLRTDTDPYITAADNMPCTRKEKTC
ncbi:hypothetical protein NQ318_020599 [Aromia moschata]|uniref:Uncharacterized protein n=1 Tax=Aromia moschata TaxID=1265417 RepID=A0AAV8Z158_9CUCU|nr:hypothetical protein NQ318_020599 [Aromia moschata]